MPDAPCSPCQLSKSSNSLAFSAVVMAGCAAGLQRGTRMASRTREGTEEWSATGGRRMIGGGGATQAAVANRSPPPKAVAEARRNAGRNFVIVKAKWTCFKATLRNQAEIKPKVAWS